MFDLDTGRLPGCEALARLSDEGGLAVDQDVFIGVVERTGLVRSLGLLMLDMACAQPTAWRWHQGLPGSVTMAVNVSPLHASHSFLSEDIAGTLRS